MNEPQQSRNSDRCLDSGLLMGLRDEALSAEEQEQARAHLATCAHCTTAADDLRNQARAVYDALGALEPHTDELPVTSAAFARFQATLDITGQQAEHATIARPPVQQSKRLTQRQRRYGWLAAAVAATLIALLVLPNAAALASQFLSLFRPQQFQPVVIDPHGIEQELWSYMQNFSDVQADINNTTYPDTLSKTQAEQMAKMQLLLPDSLPAGVGHTAKFGIIKGERGTFTFDASKARAYLARTGQGSVAIPAVLDGAIYTVSLAPGVNIDYYQSCTTDHNGKLQCSGGTTFSVGEMPAPTIQASGKNSLNDLRDFMLSLPKLSDSLRHLLQHVDQNSGIVPIPVIPQENSQDVTIQGTHGLLLSESSLGSAVIWESHTIIYMVVSTISDGSQLLQAANSLH